MDSLVRVLDRLRFDDAVTALDWRGQGLAIGTADGRHHHWWACSCERLAPTHRHGVRSVRICADGTIVSVDHNGGLLSGDRCFDDEGFVAVEELDGALVAVGDRGLHVAVDRYPRAPLWLPGASLCAATLGPRTVGVGGEDGISWIDVARGTIDGHIDLAPVVAVTRDPLGRFVVCGDVSGSLHVVNLVTGEGVELAGYPDRVELVAVDALGTAVAAVADDELTVWSLADAGVTGDAPVCWRGHEAAIVTLAAAPGGTRFASGDLDGSVVVWSATGVEELRFETSSSIGALAWAPESNGLAIGTLDGRVHVMIV
jgi:WD40 repeat protein